MTAALHHSGDSLPVSAKLTAKEIVESLTVKQRTIALIDMFDAVVELGHDKNAEAFHKRIGAVLQSTERMLTEVS